MRSYSTVKPDWLALLQRLPLLFAAVLLFAVIVSSAGAQPSLAQPSGVQAPAGAGCQPWTLVFPPSPRSHQYLRDVDALAPNDIWAVGYYYDLNNSTPDTALVMHWNGVEWTVMQTPAVAGGPELNGVDAYAPDDVWAVGHCAACGVTSFIMHWDGISWTRTPTPDPPGHNTLHDVIVLAPDNVWAVGANDGFHSTVTMNWDGTAWTIVPSPNGGMFGDDNVLTSVTAISPNDMWSVGYIYPKGGTPVTLTIHWNGSQWSLVPSPNPGNYSRDLDGVAALASNDVWAVGSYSPDSGTTYLPLFLHWNGTQWLHVQAQEFPDYSVLRDVHAIAPNDIWAVGTNATCNFCPFDTLTMHWDGTAWTRVPSPNGNRDFSRLYGVTATSPGDIWAVGTTDDYDYPYRADGLTMHRVCSSGTPTPSPTGPTATRTRTATGTPSPTATPGGPPYCTQASFGPPANFAVGNSPERVAVGDFNRDGNPDIAVANGVSWNVSVLLGNGSGGFGPATNYDTTTEPAGIVVGDFNLDGTPDIAVGGYGTDRAMVMLGNGSGGFGPVTGYVVGSGPSGLATGDLNHDGKLDLVVSNGFDDTMSVLMGNGTGGFSGPTDYDLDWIPVDITLGDFNRDGHLDVAAANSFSDNVSVRLGTGTGAFGAMQLYDVAQNPRSIAVGDFNRDGNPDIATSSEDTGNMSILLGNGSGGFAAATNFPAGNGSASIGVADFSGDGILDLAAANIPGNVAVLLGNGNGGFGAVANFRAGSGPRAVAVGDFNRDGKPDMAVTNNTSNNVSVLLNTCTAIGVTPTGTPPTATNTPQATFTRTPAPPTGTSVPSSRTPTALATSVSTLTPGATTSPSPCAITFSDVRPTDYFYEAVRYLYCRGVISGYADNTFRPFNDTTRGQLSKIVVLARGWALDCPSAGHFSDVPAGSPFYCYVETAYGHGIISGYADGTFRPGNNVTRGQISKIVVLAVGWADQCPQTGHFSDVPASNPFFCFVETAYSHGIISGYADGTFRPGNNATRGQISKIVYQAVIQGR